MDHFASTAAVAHDAITPDQSAAPHHSLAGAICRNPLLTNLTSPPVRVFLTHIKQDWFPGGSRALLSRRSPCRARPAPYVPSPPEIGLRGSRGQFRHPTQSIFGGLNDSLSRCRPDRMSGHGSHGRPDH
jgi:hypothetical protein